MSWRETAKQEAARKRHNRARAVRLVAAVTPLNSRKAKAKLRQAKAARKGVR